MAEELTPDLVRMRAVAATAVALSEALKHPEKPGTLMAAQEDYDDAVAAYTDPLDRRALLGPERNCR